ncbi:formyltetrahydrofolate deformylase [Pseudoalteromonas rubra]|uniref:formyltetrahydrofolate deformylase n=1 Tax=Pseudoalteromonas rubra TaxID=43658 RepID=UPI002DB91902|nr:formyltetrahydrofolate deformylase [Pseudoalteromonas rubra]MEC4088513.1 formyltetrahydrofolate deformylase [Pseudoalteromonas rubra]
MSIVLTTQCRDDVGLIAKVTGLCFEHNLNIVRNNEFVDNAGERFFMRTELTGTVSEAFLPQLRNALPDGAQVHLHSNEKTKVVLLATKEAHCLGGMLLKQYENAFNVEIQAVIANYDTLKPLVEGFGVPFHLVSHHGLTREQHDDAMAKVIEHYQPDFIGLAKYMRVLSPDFVARFSNQIINIHHSFLPAFIGAKPYHQAFERGVKIIGATAHFVNDELDEGPIIMQDVTQVSHADSAEAMAKMGRDIEKVVFCKAIQLAAEHKLFINGNKTVVFA